MVNSFLSATKHYGNYSANFLLGTGSMTMGSAIGNSIKNRKANNMSFIKSFRTGFADGFVKSNQEVKQAGGFWKNLGKIFQDMPKNMSDGWKSGTGKNAFTKFFSSLGKSLKPLGKLMPFAMNALWLVQSLPDIVSRTKDEGIFGGIKETAKTLANMAVVSVTGAIGASFGILGMFALPMVAGMGMNMVFGGAYSEKKAEQEKAQAEQLKQEPAQSKVGQNLDITSVG